MIFNKLKINFNKLKIIKKLNNTFLQCDQNGHNCSIFAMDTIAYTFLQCSICTPSLPVSARAAREESLSLDQGVPMQFFKFLIQ